VNFLDANGKARLPIEAEARGKREDNMLEKAVYAVYRIMTRDTPNVPADKLKKLDCSLSFQAKKNNIVVV